METLQVQVPSAKILDIEALLDKAWESVKLWEPIKLWESNGINHVQRLEPFFLNERRVIRKLGCVESYQIALQSLDQIRNIILACRYQLPGALVDHTTRNELMSTFERAVARVVLKHPHMAVALANEHTNEACWTSLTSLNLDDHIEWFTVKPGEEVLQTQVKLISYSELDSTFIDRPEIPGWRIKVLHQEDQNSIEVLLVFSHVNMDAKSAEIIHQDILQSLEDDSRVPNDVPLANHVLILPKDLTLKLSPPPEVMLGFPVDENFLLKFLQDEVQTPTAQYPRSPMQAHWAPIIPIPFKTQYRSIIIPNAGLQGLLQICRQRESTITSLFHALVLFSLTPLLGSSSASAFSSMTAMDIRRFLPSKTTPYEWFDPAKAVSNYVTILGHKFDEKLVAQVRSYTSPNASPTVGSEEITDLIWSTAKLVREDITNKIDQGVNNDMIGFAQAITDWQAQLTEQARRPRTASWVITNLGVINGKPKRSTDASSSPLTEDSDWSIKNAQFLMSANVVSAALSLSMVSIKDGDLSLSCSWQDCVIDHAMGEAFMANLSWWLDFVAPSQSPEAWYTWGGFVTRFGAAMSSLQCLCGVSR